MNKILLIGINARYSHPAMALYYLREYVRDLPYSVKIKEFTIHTSAEEILKYIAEENPACAAFSVYIWNTIIVRKILLNIKNLSSRPIVLLGGPEAGYNPDIWTQKYVADYIIAGYGEEAFRVFLTSGLKADTKIIRVGNPPFSQIPFPYTDEDIRGFKNRNIYYESSRGCVFKCAYCISSREDQKLELRELNLIKDELEKLMTHKPVLVKFIDRTFNVNKNQCRAIWEHLINKYADAGTRFHFEMHPALLTEEDFGLLESAPPGLFQFEIGIQSACEEALRAVNREGKWEDIRTRVKRVIAMGTIHVHVDLIAGLPAENYKTTEFSFNEVYALGADHFQFGYLKMLPGTQIREKADILSLKYSDDPPYDIKKTSLLSREEIIKLKVISNMVDLFYNSRRFIITLAEIIPLFDSPFSFFENLAEAVPDSDKRDTRWEGLASFIISIMQRRCDKRLIMDCLRWDWCSSFKTLRYPRMLKTEALRNKRKELIRIFQNKQVIDGVNINSEIIRKSNIFVPETKEFKAKYLKNKSCALFLPDIHGPVIID